MKREGTIRGVADLFLMHAKKDFHGLFIEMKTPSGKQSPEQKAFEERCKIEGYKYVICRTFEDFENTIKIYLNN